jgi:CubicO group peptidase (beta-lactamase class C family)
LIERVSNLSYYDYVQQNLFAPAQMNRTGSLPETEIVPGRARGYMNEDGKWVRNTDTLPWRGTAAGGGYSTVGDLLRFADALQEGKLISKDLLTQATRLQALGYGYGFGVGGAGPWMGYGHGGGAPGMNGELRVIPELGYVLISLSNMDPPAASRALQYVEARLPSEP